MRHPHRAASPVAILAVMMTVIGCGDPPDERLHQMAEQSLHRQAEQNELIAGQSRQVTTATRDLLTSEGEARQQLIDMQKELAQLDAGNREDLSAIQQDLVERDAEGRAELNALRRDTEAAIQTERQSIDRQREALESERKVIAEQRHRAPIVAAAITQAGLILACLAPLLLGAYVIYTLRRSSNEDEDVSEVLVRELLAGPSAVLLPHDSSAGSLRDETSGPSDRPSLEAPDNV